MGVRQSVLHEHIKLRSEIAEKMRGVVIGVYIDIYNFPLSGLIGVSTKSK